MDIQNKPKKRGDILDGLVSAIKRIKDIPTLPKILSKISEEMGNDDYSIKDIGELMSLDVSLSSRILRMVNSPFYGFPQRIYSINHAIVLLGANVLKSIVISTSVFTVMKEAMEGLWEHSLFCAFTAKYIAAIPISGSGKKENKMSKNNGIADADMMFSAGLLHDIGKIITAIAFKDDFKKIMIIAKEDKRPLTDIEHDTLNISHDQLGYMLAREWNLPSSIYLPIKYHHNVNLASEFKTETAILNLSDYLTRAMGIGYSGNTYIEKINADTVDILNIDLNFIKNIVEEVYPFKNELSIFD